MSYGKSFNADLVHYLFESGNLSGAQASPNHVIEGDHAVRLSAAEVGL